MNALLSTPGAYKQMAPYLGGVVYVALLAAQRLAPVEAFAPAYACGAAVVFGPLVALFLGA
jgi:hypothetical protein